MAEGDHTTAGSAARAMLDAFAGVGASAFNVSWTNSAGKPRRPRSLRNRLQSFGPLPTPNNPDWLDSVHIGGISTADLSRIVPALLDTANAERLNLIVRPLAEGVTFVQLDDLTSAKHQITTDPLSGRPAFGTPQLAKLAPAQFLTLETSPGSFQVWLAVPGKHSRQFARRVRKAVGADVNASGATRIAGSRNYKDKYAPDFPVVAIRDHQPGRTVTATELDRLGLVAPPDEFAPLPPALSATPYRWPIYRKALDGAPKKADGTPDRSKADYVFAMTCISWGFSVDATARRLMTESDKAQEEGPGYAADTARNAAGAVQNRQPEPPRRMRSTYRRENG
jgi:hypothetical protein